MFGDWTWIGGRYEPQERDLNGWLGGLVQAKARLAVVELGAGKAIPTVRWRAEGVARAAAASGQQSGGALIRINPDPLAAGVPRGAGVALRPARSRHSPRSIGDCAIRPCAPPLRWTIPTRPNFHNGH